MADNAFGFEKHLRDPEGYVRSFGSYDPWHDA